MSNLVDPLQLLLNQAGQAKESGKLDLYAQRVNANPLGVNVILLDISGSMNERVESGQRKIDILREALDRPLLPDEVAIAFHSISTQLPNLQSIPEPGGGTALHLALAQVIKLHPRQTLVVSDGKPNLKEQALIEAQKITGLINTLYIGRDNDLDAIRFMRELARTRYGVSRTCDIRIVTPKELGAAITFLLKAAN